MDQVRKPNRACGCAVVVGMLSVLRLSALAQQKPEMPEMGPHAGMAMTCQCPMDGPMGAVMMALGGLLVLAAIGALIALAVFLIRRSGPGRPAPA
jgi:hypothetical protein